MHSRLVEPSNRCDLLVDGNALFGISFFSANRESASNGPFYHDINGNPSSGIVSGIRRLLGMISDRNQVLYLPERMLVCFDGVAKTDKKRGPKPLGYHDELARFKIAVQEFFGASVHTSEAEADDAVASALEHQTTNYACIVTSDKDLFQVVAPGVLYHYLPKRRLVEESEFLRTHPCRCAKFLPIWLAICGDARDGIAGVRGAGPKKAAEVLDAIKPEVPLREAIHLAAQKFKGKKRVQFYEAIMATTLFGDEKVPAPKEIIVPAVRHLAGMGYSMLNQYVADAREALNGVD